MACQFQEGRRWRQTGKGSLDRGGPDSGCLSERSVTSWRLGLPPAPVALPWRHSQRKPAADAFGPEQRHIEIRGLTPLPKRAKTLPHISNDAVIWKVHEAGPGRFKPPDFPVTVWGIV